MHSIFVVALLLLGQSSLAVIKDIPIGSMKAIRETGVQVPYKETATYNYSKGNVFDRWVYNPWVKLSTDQVGQKAIFSSTSHDRGYLSLEAVADTSHLQSGQAYSISAEIDYSCALAKESEKGLPKCRQDFVVRCYGYVDGQWSILLDVKRSLGKSDPQGTFKISGIKFDRKKCNSGISLVLKGHLNTGVQNFVFKEMKVGFKKL